MSGVLIALCALASAALALWQFRAAWVASWVVRAALGRRTQRIADVRGTAIETRGRLHTEQPVFASGQERCIAVRFDVVSEWATYGRRGGSVSHDSTESRRLFATSATLADESGHVELDVAEATFVGERRITSLLRDAFLKRFPDLAGLVHPKATTITLHEERLDIGADVRVWAARVNKPNEGGSVYRRSASGPTTLLGDETRGLMIAPASEARLGLRALPPALGMLSVALLCSAYAAWLVRALWIGWG